MDEKELTIVTKQLKNSDRKAFKIIFEIFQKDIFNFLIYKINDLEIAEDLLQETFIKLWENRQNLDEAQSIKAFICTIANNLSLNYIRHEKIVLKFRENNNFQFHTNEDPQSILEYKEFNNIIQKAMNNLAEKPRMVFLLSRSEKLSYREISERMNIEVSTVESHMVNALRVIREEIKKYNS